MILLGIIYSIAIVQSCDPCSNSDESEVYYGLSAISTNTLRLLKKRFSMQIDSPIESYINYDLDEDYISYYSIGIEILSEVNQISLNEFTNKGSVFSSAIACEPFLDYDNLSNISITSSVDYNDEIKVGDEMNHIFLIRRDSYVSGTPLLEFLNETNSFSFTGDKLLLTFSEPPNSRRTHNLTITFTIEGGAIFTEEILGLKISDN